MTPETQAHIENVARLRRGIDETKATIEQMNSDLGLVAIGLERDQRPPRPKVSLTMENMEALQQAERKLQELEDEFFAAIRTPHP